MVQESSRPVVVGVDGTEASDSAVRYALAESRRRGTGILIVHVIHETAPMVAMLPLYSVEAFTEVGRRLVADAEKLVLHGDSNVEVSTSVQEGSRVGILAHVGEHASAIVLGHRSRALPGRLLGSSTTTGVAARAHCPVISVPDSWVEGRELGRVVVGVDESRAAQAALDTGFQEARRRHAKVIALHAWRPPTAYSDIGYSQDILDDWFSRATKKMETALVPFREAYPDVEVEAALQHEFAGPALVTATRDADLIVVGRRGHGAPWGFYLGSLARLLIREGHCPVEIAPQEPRNTTEGLLLEDGDALSPQM